MAPRQPTLEEKEHLGPAKDVDGDETYGTIAKLEITPNDGVDPDLVAIQEQDELERVTMTMARMVQALGKLERKLLEEITDDKFYETIHRHEMLTRNLEVLEFKGRSLEWRKLARSRTFGFSPDNMESIQGICKDIGSRMAVIAAFSATISISILYSAVRGDLFFFFGAWWCSIISLTSSLGLSVLRVTKRSPRPIDWIILHISGVIALLCLLASAGSVISMCYGVMFFDVSAELIPERGDPHITNGPSVPTGVPKTSVVIASVIMAIFFACFLVSVIKPFRVARQKHWAQQTERKSLKERRRAVVTV